MTEQEDQDNHFDEILGAAKIDPAELAESSTELTSLREHWDQRIAEFDPSKGGEAAVRQETILGTAVRRFRQNKLASFSLLVIAVMVLLAIFVPIFSHANANSHDFAHANLGPSLSHPFGTDNFGRDMWLRSWIGARISLSIGFAVAFMVLIIGLVYGSVSGFFGGRIDNAMMRLLDALYGLPSLPFAIIFIQIVLALNQDANPLLYMAPALSISSWFTAARIVRNQVLSLKEDEFIEAARAGGASSWRILLRHLMPNTLGLMVIVVFLEIPTAILSEAVLSYLGIGVQPPNASWGTMANDGYQYFQSYPMLIVVPGALIAIVVLCAIAVADGLRDALDPRGQTN